MLGTSNSVSSVACQLEGMERTGSLASLSVILSCESETYFFAGLPVRISLGVL